MSIDITYSEDKERLKQERRELKYCLEDVKLLTHINEFIDEDIYINNYIKTHNYLTIEELESRIIEITNIFNVIYDEN